METYETASARFDSMVAAGERDREVLTPVLAEDLKRLQVLLAGQWSFDHEQRSPAPNLGRVLVLAAANGDEHLWHTVLRYLITRDSFHRTAQKMSGTPKEDLGPLPTPARAADWAGYHFDTALGPLPPEIAERLRETLAAWRRAAKG